MSQQNSLDNQENDKGTFAYRSFLLRCRRNPLGEIHVRLVDVQTGRAYLIPSLVQVEQHIRDIWAQEINDSGGQK
jgi:tRNA (Thr-GGU) A37 N-methylase